MRRALKTLYMLTYILFFSLFSGKLKIAEVTSRFRNVKTFIFAVEQMGFELKKKVSLVLVFGL